MRGKNILWFSLIAMLFSAMMATLVSSQGCTILVDPSEIHNEDMSMAGFTIDIRIEDAVDLFSYAFVLDYAPYSKQLVARSVTEGDFLKQGGFPDDFTFKIDHFSGEVKIGNARLGDVPGASGSGLLASIEFAVTEAGESPLDLLYVELYDSDGETIACDIVHGMYFGPHVELTSGFWMSDGQWGGDRDYPHWKDNLIFSSSVTNHGEVPLNVRVKFDLVRKDGRVSTIWAGQDYVTTVREPVYLYVNEYNAALEWDWTNPGASVIGMPDGNYAESIVNGAMSSAYGFEDLTLGPGDAIFRVSLEGYCRYPNGPTDAVDIDVYTIWGFDWLGSLFGGPDFAWVTPRWIGADVTDVLPELQGKDATPLNNLEVLLYNYHGDADNPMQVDALRLRVEFAQNFPIAAPIWTLGPGESLDLDDAIWALAKEDKGFYRGTATVYFSYYYPSTLPIPFSWVMGEPRIPLWIWIPGQGSPG